MDTTDEMFNHLKSQITSRYKERPSMVTLGDLEYIVNEAMLDGDITFSQCNQLRADIERFKYPDKHAKQGTRGKQMAKAVKEAKKEKERQLKKAKQEEERKFKQEQAKLQREIAKQMRENKKRKQLKEQLKKQVEEKHCKKEIQTEIKYE